MTLFLLAVLCPEGNDLNCWPAVFWIP